MKNISLVTAACLLFFLLMIACKDKCLTTGGNPPLPTGGEQNGIYYWRTTFSLSEYEKEFLARHNVKRLYVKFFDVQKDWKAESGYDIVPEATIQFKDSILPGIDLIPTVYITQEAIQSIQLKEAEYADRILKRVKAMCRHHGIQLKELQLDCDWTKRTQKYFYKLCQEIKQLLDTTQTLSSTIRLHQLTQTPPPVDKGVLMVYNTGNLMEMSTDNSIFSQKDIEPYLRDNRLAKYSLALDVAYPAYGWSLVFRPGEDRYVFDRIMQRTEFSDYPEIKSIDKNIYEVTSDVNFTPDERTGDRVYAGYRIRVERPDAKEILSVKRMIEKQLGHKPHYTILYHLDESQLSHYSDNEITKLYSGN